LQKIKPGKRCRARSSAIRECVDPGTRQDLGEDKDSIDKSQMYFM